MNPGEKASMKFIVAAQRHRLLERAALVYISVPFLIFTLGWLRPLCDRSARPDLGDTR
jgi:hypothetical protein